MSRKMKESGIDWIGSIPMPWNTIKFKYLHGGMNTGEGIDKLGQTMRISQNGNIQVKMIYY